MRLADRIRLNLADLAVLPRRLELKLAEPCPVSVALLRGVWGAALHESAGEVYREVFEGEGSAHLRTPQYVLRLAQPPGTSTVTLEWVTFGSALRCGEALIQAWRLAGVMGLGSERIPFQVREVLELGPGGAPAPVGTWPEGWPVSLDRSPVSGVDGTLPVRVAFPSGVRVMRRLAGTSRAVLTESPGPAEIALGALRRLAACMPEGSGINDGRGLLGLHDDVRDYAQGVPHLGWQGQRSDYSRYSARQRDEYEIRAVTGHLDLPKGSGEIWPLIAAAQWLHIGKGTTLGLGQLVILPLPDPSTSDTGEIPQL